MLNKLHKHSSKKMIHALLKTYSSYCRAVSLCVWHAVHNSTGNRCYEYVAVVALNC